MLLFILLVVVVLIGILLYLRSRCVNVKETFRVRKDMDDVLDNYCSITAPRGYNNYEGPWTDSTSARCGKYSCPTEKCYRIEKDRFNYDNHEAYYFAPYTSNMVWKDADSVPEDGADSVPEDGAVPDITCTTNHNPETNIHCEPNDIPHCADVSMFNQLAHYFNTTTSEWDEMYINTFMNSNGVCHLRNANYPYDIVNLKNTGNDTEFLQTSNAGARYTVYLNRGPTCQLNLDYGNNFSDDAGNSNIKLISSLYNGFDQRTNSFICSSGNGKMRYGYTSNNLGVTTGFECGWLDTECVACPPEKSHCYVFNSDDRTYKKNNYLQVFFDDDGDQGTTDNECREYLVNDNMSDFFEDNNPQVLSDSDPCILDRMLIRDGNVNGEGHTVTKPSVCETLPTDCSPTTTYCYQMGADINSNAKPSYTAFSSRDVISSEIPFDNKIVGVEYRRRYNAYGSACEYCIIDPSTNECLIDTTPVTTLPTVLPTPCKREFDVECPKGYELNNDFFQGSYCTVCSSSQYYDSTDSNCKNLDGCDSGKYFDPFNNIIKGTSGTNDEFLMYNITEKQAILDIKNGDPVNPTDYDNTLFSYLNNNSSAQCEPCSGSNMYMDLIGNTELECKTCPYNNGTYIMTTNPTRDQCSECVIPNVVQTSPNPKYLELTDTHTDTHRTCETCPVLPTTDVQRHFTSIEAITPDDAEGKCYRKCDRGRTYGAITLLAGDKDYNTTTLEYPVCDYTCADNYFKDGVGGCTKCPIGTQNLNNATACVECPQGTYNNVAGSYCQNCPRGSGNMTNQIVSTLSVGSSNITDCRIDCKGSTPTVKASYNGGYNLTTCPSEECTLSGYRKAALYNDSDQNKGYKLEPIIGNKNTSLDSTRCVPITPISTPNVTGCDSGFNQFTNGNNKVCCKIGLNYNTSTKICECSSVSYYNDQFDTTHVETVAYDSPTTGCLPYTCKEEISIRGNQCILDCAPHQYKNISASTCSNCPPPPNAATMKTVNRGTSASDCIVDTCAVGYYKSRDGISCIQETVDCAFYEDVVDGSIYNPTFSSYHSLDNNTSTIENGELPSFHKMKRTQETSCPTTSTDSCGSVITSISGENEISVCCPNNSYSTFSKTRNYDKINSLDGIIITENNMFYDSKNRGACCENINSKQLKISIDENFKEFYGCCSR
jgi:hypothetical protein